MTDDMKKRFGELICIAPWTELNLERDKGGNKEMKRCKEGLNKSK